MIESLYDLTFGAMAKSADDRQFAFSAGQPVAGQAAAEAVATCRQQSGQACSVVQTFRNQCATLAWPASLGRQPESLSDATLALGITSTDSKRLALANCAQRHGAQCRVGYTACAGPLLKADRGAGPWSAVAIDPATLKVFPAIASGANATSARAAAYDRCQRAPGVTGDCEVLDHFPVGACRWLARSIAPVREGDYTAIIRERSDPALATRQCEAKAGSACEIVWRSCA